MLELESTAADDGSFLDLVSRLIAGAADASRLSDLFVCHIDHWFGPRWLGFRGKVVGAAGVHNRRLTADLAPPPFHPHRILSVRAYRLGESQAFESQGDVGWLHGPRSSESNVRRSLPGGRPLCLVLRRHPRVGPRGRHGLRRPLGVELGLVCRLRAGKTVESVADGCHSAS